MNPNINPKAKTNIKNMIRDALNCQKKNRNSIVLAFCATTNNTKNPRKMLKVHLEFIVFPLCLFEIYCSATGGSEQGKAYQKSGDRIIAGGPHDNQPQRLKAAIVLASVMPPRRKSLLTADLRRGFVRIISSVSLVPVRGVSFSALKMWITSVE